MTQFPLAYFGLGGMELVILLVIALLLFGRRLPEAARGLGRSLLEFKKGLKHDDESEDKPQS